MIVLIDSGVLGKLCNPNRTEETIAVNQWLFSLLRKGAFVVSSDICDYEVRRSLILESLRKPNIDSIQELDDLENYLTFLPLTNEVIKEAARIWAEAVRPRVGVRRLCPNGCKGTRTEAFRECPLPTNKASMLMSLSAPSISY